jgi:hypothetical protein
MTRKQSCACLRLSAVFTLILLADWSAMAQSAPQETAPKMSSTVSSQALAGFTFSVPIEPPRSPPPHGLTLWSDEPTVLSPMQVSARPLKLSETEVLTEKGLLEYAKIRYTTPLYRVTFGPLAQLGMYYFNFLTILGGWHPNDAEAMAFYHEGERVRIVSEVDSLVSLVDSLGSKQDQAELKQLRYQVRQQGIQSLYWNPFK